MIFRIPKTVFSFFGLLLLPFCASYAQDYKLDIENFTTEDGLSHNQVRCIFEDSRGILWIGTPNGLNRYDGEGFKLFTKEKHGLTTNKVENILEDKNGMLWLKLDVGADYRNSGITIFNPIKEQAEDQASYLGESFPIDVKSIREIRPGAERALFLTTVDSTALIFKGKSNYTKKDILKLPTSLVVEEPFLWEKSLSSFWIRGLEFKLDDFNNSKYDTSYLAKVDINGTILKKMLSPIVYQNSKISFENSTYNIFYYFLIDEFGVLNFFNYHFHDGQLNEMRFWENGDILDLSKAGVIQYVDEEIGLMIFSNNISPNHENRLSTYYFTKALGKGNYEILNKGVIPVERAAINVVKAQNSFWFHTGGNGLFRLKVRAKKFQSFNTGVQQRNLVLDEANRIWINAQDKFETESTFSHGYFAHSEQFVKDDLDCIWGLHYHFKVLIKSCPLDYQTKLFPKEWRAIDRTRGYNYLFKDKNKRIWVFPKAQQLNENGEFHPFKARTSLDSLKFYTIYHVWQEKDNHFWMATGGALYELDENLNLLGTYNQTGKDKYFIPSNEVHHFHVDSEGIFWLATGQDGLIRWDRVNENFQHFTKEDGLATNILHAVYEDEYGFLWLNSENGIIRFNKENYTSTQYGTEDGISHLEGNSRSHLRGEDGTLYFGSLVGVTKFHPKDFANEDAVFRPNSIEIFTVYQKDVQTGETINLLPDYLEKGQLELRSRQAFIEITFVPPDIEVQRTSHFEYQIKGGNDNWIQIDKNRMTLADLPFGITNLKVRNTDFNGNSTPILEISICNPTPFYLQWWFILLTILVLVIVGIVYGRWRTRNLKYQREQLKQEVAKQTATIQQKNKLLEAQATELRNLDDVKSRFFANVSHELRTPLTLLLGPIQTILKRNRLENRDFTLLALARENGQQLLGMINQILDLTKLESSTIELKEETIDLYQLSRRIFSFFESHAEIKGIQFEFHFLPDRYLKVLLDAGKFETLVKNLLSNALKFTPNKGKVALTVLESSNKIKVEVQDSGRGIHPDDLPHVFERYFQSSQKNVPAEGGSGIGLAICKEFADLMDGALNVSSVLGQGSKFSFEFPKKEVLAKTDLSNSSDEVMTLDGLNQNSKERIEEILPFNTPSNGNEKDSKDTILLVEDNHSLRDYISFILEEHYHVITATNGQEGIDLLTIDGKGLTVDGGRLDAEKNRLPSTVHHQPSLIISDVMMPVMDGFQFLKNLKSREEWRGIPVIMLTARAASADKLNALRIGVDDYMLKPFDDEELVIRIANLLGNRKERQLWQAKGNNDNDVVHEMNQEDVQWLRDLEGVVKAKIGDFNLTAEQLAYELNLSRRQFFRRVKMSTGLTPNQYILEVRYNHARHLFENRIKSSVKAVAYEIGVKDVKYFSRQFKQRFGKLPSEYFMKT